MLLILLSELLFAFRCKYLFYHQVNQGLINVSMCNYQTKIVRRNSI